MDAEKKLKLQRLGGVFAFLGLGSILLSLFEYNFILLAWIDFFGDMVAWIIRIGLIAIGTILYFKYDVDDADLFFEDDEDDPL